MGVVINEFEVITEAHPVTQPAGGTPSGASLTVPPPVQDIERIVRRQIERFARIWAH